MKLKKNNGTGNIAKGKTNVDEEARKSARTPLYGGDIPVVGATGEGGPGSYQCYKGDAGE